MAEPPLPLPMLGMAVAVGVCNPTPVAALDKSSIEGLLCLLFRLGVGLQSKVIASLQREFMALYLRLEEDIAAQHVHLDAHPQHRVVQAVTGVVALEEEATRGEAGAGELGKIEVDKTQLIVTASALHLLAYRDAQVTGIEDAGRGICTHLAGKLEAAVPLHAMVANILALME